MNDTEELLRRTLRDHVRDAPHVVAYTPPPRSTRKTRWLAPLTAAAVAAAVVAGIAWYDQQWTLTDPAPAAESVLDRVEGLIGPAVADELGLVGEPDTDADLSCNGTVVVDHYAVRYCLTPVSNDPAVQMVIASQIAGLPRTASTLAYARAFSELQELYETTDSEDPATWDLQEQVSDLHDAVSQERRHLHQASVDGLRGATTTDDDPCGQDGARYPTTNVIGAPEQIVICGPAPGQRTTLTPDDSETFAQVIEALTHPSGEHPRPKVSCAAMATPPLSWDVIVRTSTGNWVMSQPHNICGVLPQVRQALTVATSP